MKICVPIQTGTQKDVQRRLKEAAKVADLAEIWLDQVGDLDIQSLLAEKPLPVVCVCKRPSDQGQFKGSYAQLAEVLMQAIEYGADYIDIPFQMPEKLSTKIVQSARKRRCKVILSTHNFKATPNYPALVKVADALKKRGADVVKIATQANEMEDTVNIIALAKHLQGLKIPHILIAMGQKGVLSRILSPTLGGEMMFATLGKKGQTAPGQLSVTALRRAWSLIQPK